MTIKNLKKAREITGKTQQEVADHLKMSRANYTNFENGVWKPKDPEPIFDKIQIFLVPLLQREVEKLTTEWQVLAALYSDVTGRMPKAKEAKKKLLKVNPKNLK